MNAKVELFDVLLYACGSAGLRSQNSTSETTVVATRCQFANNKYGVLVDGSSTSATFNNCVFNDNEVRGIVGSSNATVHLHGEATAVHSNGKDGIAAYCSGKVIIHLPSHHNTSYNNGDEDRYTGSTWEGTITNVED